MDDHLTKLEAEFIQTQQRADARVSTAVTCEGISTVCAVLSVVSLTAFIHALLSHSHNPQWPAWACLFFTVCTLATSYFRIELRQKAVVDIKRHYELWWLIYQAKGNVPP